MMKSQDHLLISVCRVDRHVGEPELRKMRRGCTQGRRCRATGKIRYRDVEEAKRALRRAMTRAEREIEDFGDTTRHESRIYACACSGWHLSSKDAHNLSAEVYRA